MHSSRMHTSLVAVLVGVVSSAPLEPDSLPRGIWFDNETLLKEQLAHNEMLTNESRTSNYYSTCNLNGVFKMPMCFQICNEWCWAATTSMMIQAYTGGNQCQGFECQLPSTEFHRQCCPYTNSCHNSPRDPSSACNHGGTGANIANAATTFSGVNHVAGRAFSQQQLDQILNSRHPVVIGVYWTTGGGHALLIGGCSRGRYYVHDPWGWYSQGGTRWQALTYSQLLQYVAPNGGVGQWAMSVTAASSAAANESVRVVSLSESADVIV